MNTETKPSDEQNERAARRTVEVTVSAQTGSPNPIDPETITLNNSVLRVIWRCMDLPPDTRLQIVFEGDARGPFFLLESTGSEVIGWGNRGPEETERRYTYQATIQTGTGMESIGVGILKNLASDEIPIPRDGDWPPPPPVGENPQ